MFEYGGEPEWGIIVDVVCMPLSIALLAADAFALWIGCDAIRVRVHAVVLW